MFVLHARPRSTEISGRRRCNRSTGPLAAGRFEPMNSLGFACCASGFCMSTLNPSVDVDEHVWDVDEAMSSSAPCAPRAQRKVEVGNPTCTDGTSAWERRAGLMRNRRRPKTEPRPSERHTRPFFVAPAFFSSNSAAAARKTWVQH